MQKKAASLMPDDALASLADRLRIRREQAEAACRLLDPGEPGLNPVFIAHYRKSATGGLDERTLRRLAWAREDQRAIAALRQRVRREAERQGPAADEFARVADEAADTETLRDLLDLARPGRRTAASVARERGLGPLAEYAWQGVADGPDLAEQAADFLSHEREVRSAEDALAGAAHILAERISRLIPVRAAVRRLLWEKGLLVSRQSRRAGRGAKPNPEFRAYFKFEEPVGHVPPHRVLAINRGERSKALKVSVTVPEETLLGEVMPMLAPPEHRFAEFLKSAAADALRRLVVPVIEREVRRRLTEKAEAHAIDVFAVNLESLFLTPPLRHTRVLVIQPGFRSGCKVAVLNADGGLLGETIVYPHEPQRAWLEAKTALMAVLRQHGVQAIAIGNGTGCRATEELVSEVIEENHLDLEYTIVNEAGAGMYADSTLAKEEFPNIEAALRVAVSIGRRLQDPLAELVKIDPRAIGVGLYQHDVNQDRLKASLEEKVQSCVSAVGADANRDSPAMLHYVPGLGPAQIEALVARRRADPIRTRDDLRGLPGWDDRAFLQAAGFLRVAGPNPLDSTRIHPESYPAAERLLARVGHAPADLKDPTSAKALEKDLTGIALEPLARDLEIPMLDLVDLVGALQHPDADPRARQARPIFRKKMRRIEDLKPGMWVKGTVRNVVDFGAFVDVGLAEDGLVHISQFSQHYIRNPMKFLHVGDVVEARVVTIDTERQRTALSLVPEAPPPKPTAPKAVRPESRRSRDRKAPTAKPAAAPAPAATARETPTESPRSKAPAVERRVTRGEPRRAGTRRPARGERDGRPAPRGAKATGRDKTPAGRSRPEKGPPRSRSAEPRVHVFRDEAFQEPRLPDEQGRPKIRWAHYESDLPEEEPPGEFDAEMAEAVEQTEAGDASDASEDAKPSEEENDTV